MLFFVVKSSNS